MKMLYKPYGALINLSNVTLSPLLDLAIRLYMANIFWVSGKLKYDIYVNEGLEEVALMFEDNHPIPGVDPEIAAIAGMGGELILPVLLAIGLFTRIGAAGLLVMTLVIQFVVPEEYELANPEHYYWMLLLAVPMLKGGGILSIDGIAQKFMCCKGKCGKKTEGSVENPKRSQNREEEA